MSQGAPSPTGGLPRPGWYPDPVPGWGGLRWWDGVRWTSEVASVFPPPPPPPVPPPAPQPEPPAAQEPAPPDERPAIPARALWWAIVGLLLGEVLGGLLGGAAAAFTSRGTNSPAVILLGELGLWAGMAWACRYVSRRYGTSSLVRDFGLRIRPVDLAWGVAAAVVATLLSVAAASAFSGTRFAGTNTQIITGQRHNSAGIAVITVIVALGAPLFEELFFRGLIRTALVDRFGRSGAIVGQAVLFGIAHFDPGNGLGNVDVIVTITLLGLLLGYVATRTGRLGAGMVGHGLFNLLTAILVITT